MKARTARLRAIERYARRIAPMTRGWRAPWVEPPCVDRMRRRAAGQCLRCEYTTNGWFAYPCAKHGCWGCGHLKHDATNCAHPDPRTGWCECEKGPNAELYADPTEEV